ncbi:MAG TPA: biotin/lipoyl-containing protein [Bacteroidota bacterium]|nr:biotin/lipoyl-containing protein [Bacteroidota bacterium]
MHTYFMTSGGKEHVVIVHDDGTVLLDGRRTSLDITRIDANTFSILLHGGSHTLVASRTNSGYEVLSNGILLRVGVETERERLLRQYAGTAIAGHHRFEVHAPMPAMVARIQVNVGDEVTEGQGLIILEAMKMENELRAQQTGKVKEIWVVVGKAVEKGQLLLLLE